MSKKEEKRETQFRPSLERLVRRVLEHYPERNYESENDFYDALDEYETTINDNYEKLLADHNRLTQLMYSNPRMGAFISDVAEGEDAVVACVRYFGKELLDGCGDKEKLQALRMDLNFMKEALYGDTLALAREDSDAQYNFEFRNGAGEPLCRMVLEVK